MQHGESEWNKEGKIGGDSQLSPNGVKYAIALANYINEQNIKNLRVWTSWHYRTIQTASGVQAPQERWKSLNEIDAVRNTIIYNYIDNTYDISILCIFSSVTNDLFVMVIITLGINIWLLIFFHILIF